MSIIHFESSMQEQQRRQKLYEGHLFVYSPRPSLLALCDFARQLTEQAFGSIHPTLAQHHFAPEDYARVLSRLKSTFINHPHSKLLVQRILAEMGCDLDKTYFDLPRMRTSTSHSYLTTGISYSFDPHRDTWFSAPLSQLNWWLPLYDIEAENCLNFYPEYWERTIHNESAGYDCRQWRAESERLHTTGQPDVRKRPCPLESVESAEQLRLLCPVGGLILFSGAHLHGTVPNTTGLTRFSLDFRTVHLGDVATHVGAPNLDSQCTGTLLGDFLHPVSLAPLPAALIAAYEPGTPLVEAVPMPA
jgi:hypothetical protein